MKCQPNSYFSREFVYMDQATLMQALEMAAGMLLPIHNHETAF